MRIKATNVNTRLHLNCAGSSRYAGRGGMRGKTKGGGDNRKMLSLQLKEEQKHFK